MKFPRGGRLGALMVAVAALNVFATEEGATVAPLLVDESRYVILSESVEHDADGWLELALAHDERRQHERAAEAYQRAAGLGVGAAEFRLGLLYETGIGVKQSYEQARSHYEQAVGLGVAEANLRLGMFYMEGWGVAADSAAALAHIERAAEAGHMPAQKILSDMYFAGVNVTKDAAKALVWAERAAAFRDPASQLRIGVIRQAAVKVPQDIQLAREWYQLSAEQDYTRGMLAMAGTFLRRGADAANIELGLRWLDLAAAGGNAGAAFYRAGAYLRPSPGLPTDENVAKARALFQQAADASEFAAIEVLELEKSGLRLDAAFVYVMTVPFDDRYVQRLQQRAGPSKNGLVEPRPLKVVRPIYPAAMRLTETEGDAMVEFIVDMTGRVRDARTVSSTHPAFSQIAADSVMNWRFLPGTKDGRPVNTRLRVPVSFRMSEVGAAQVPLRSTLQQAGTQAQ